MSEAEGEAEVGGGFPQGMRRVGEEVVFTGGGMEGGISGGAVEGTVERSGRVSWGIIDKRGEGLARKGGEAGGAMGVEGGVVEDGGERAEGWGEVFAYADILDRSHLHF